MKHTLFNIALVSFLTLSSIAHAGPGGGNGGFLGENAKAVLEAAIQELKGLVPFIQDSRVTPERKTIILDALNHVILKKSLPSQKALVFDYPRVQNPKNEIYVYEHFNLIYDQSDVSVENTNAVQIRLLREISHLWGMNDPESMEFAKTAWQPARAAYFADLRAREEKQKEDEHRRQQTEIFVASPLSRSFNLENLSGSVGTNWSKNEFEGCEKQVAEVIKETFLEPEVQKLAGEIVASSRPASRFDVNKHAEKVNVYYEGHYDATLKESSLWHSDTYTITYSATLTVSEQRKKLLYSKYDIENYEFYETNPVRLQLPGLAVGITNSYRKDSADSSKPLLAEEFLIQNGVCTVTKELIIEQLKKLANKN